MERNAKGQATVELLLVGLIFLVLIGGIIRSLPMTFSQATPYLGGKIEQRLETGRGFAQGHWRQPFQSTGGIKDQ